MRLCQPIYGQSLIFVFIPNRSLGFNLGLSQGRSDKMIAPIFIPLGALFLWEAGEICRC